MAWIDVAPELLPSALALLPGSVKVIGTLSSRPGYCRLLLDASLAGFGDGDQVMIIAHEELTAKRVELVLVRHEEEPPP